MSQMPIHRYPPIAPDGELWAAGATVLLAFLLVLALLRACGSTPPARPLSFECSAAECFS